MCTGQEGSRKPSARCFLGIDDDGPDSVSYGFEWVRRCRRRWPPKDGRRVPLAIGVAVPRP